MERLISLDLIVNDNSGGVQDTEWPPFGWGLGAGCVELRVMLTHFGSLGLDLEITNIKMGFSMADTGSHFGLQRHLLATSKTTHCFCLLEQTFPSQQMNEPPEFGFERIFFSHAINKLANNESKPTVSFVRCNDGVMLLRQNPPNFLLGNFL